MQFVFQQYQTANRLKKTIIYNTSTYTRQKKKEKKGQIQNSVLQLGPYNHAKFSRFVVVVSFHHARSL